jgi:phage tail tape-measure protein
MAWYNRNKGAAGAIAGGAIGSVVPVVGTLIGAIAGAFIGPVVINDEPKEKQFNPEETPPDDRTD